MDYEVVIGLEVHAQLLTKSKIFCACSTEFGKPANANTCEVCWGMPGVLPALNGAVVDMAVRTGLALGCTVHGESIWSRKNYFYPDLPKGYQVSQYDRPICTAGELVITVGETDKRVRVTRVHMEEDAGKNIHDEASGHSFVDYNRAGVPLLEIVSEPDMRNAAEAVAYVKTLRAVLRALGVCDGNMEEGSLRCDANVSLRRQGQEKYGTRTELKNINSFRFLQQAIEYEIERHRQILDDGGRIVQETRLYDNAARKTISMRSKEEAHDYRYFPEPDLPPVLVDAAWIERARREMPELPRARAERYQREHKLSANDANVLVAELEVAEYFECALRAYPKNAKGVANWIINELLAVEVPFAQVPVSAEHLAELVRLVDEGKITGKIAKAVFADMLASGTGPAAVIAKNPDYQPEETGVVEKAVRAAVENNPGQVEKYRGGKKALRGFFVGEVMKATRGKADPALVNQLLDALLDGK